MRRSFALTALIVAACGADARAPRADAARPAIAAVDVAAPITVTMEADAAPEPLEAEPAEPNPQSGTVKLRLLVTPVPADVIWGGKKLGTTPARGPFEIERPRGSGPLDLLVHAAGYVPFHTRLYSDRDETVPVHLTRGGRSGKP